MADFRSLKLLTVAKIVNTLYFRSHTDHLGIDSSTDLDDRYSNLFRNAYINRHAHTEYLKMI